MAMLLNPDCCCDCAQLLGMNVADSRKSCTHDGKWDAPTARAIGLHLLNAISGMCCAAVFQAISQARYTLSHVVQALCVPF